MIALPGRLTVPRTVPGDGLLHPLALAAVALLIVNDHFLKQAYPGFVTGKLSDFAGLVFFPLLLVAAYEVGASAAARRSVIAGRRALLLAAGATAVVFVAIKLVPAVNESAARLLGAAQALVTLQATSRPAPFAMDATDLIALPSVLIAVALGVRRVDHQ